MSERAEALKREGEALDLEVAKAAIPPAPEVPPGEPGAAAVQEAPAPEVVTPEQEAEALIQIVLELVDPAYPSLKEIYTPEARERLARAAGPLMKKYNFSLSSLEKWKEEIDFALVALPLALATARAIQTENLARKIAGAIADKMAEKPAAPPPPASSPAKPAAAPASDAVVFP